MNKKYIKLSLIFCLFYQPLRADPFFTAVDSFQTFLQVKSVIEKISYKIEEFKQPLLTPNQAKYYAISQDNSRFHPFTIAKNFIYATFFSGLGYYSAKTLYEGSKAFKGQIVRFGDKEFIWNGNSHKWFYAFAAGSNISLGFLMLSNAIKDLINYRRISIMKKQLRADNII